jgi:hypothetical protein
MHSASGSHPIYTLNNESHDSDNTRNSMYRSPVVTAALEEWDTSSRRNHVAHGAVPEAPASSRILTRTRTRPHRRTYPYTASLEDMMLAGDGTCNYVPIDGKACGEKMLRRRDAARHWFTTHAMKELQLIDSSSLDMGRATIIKTDAKKRAAGKYIVRCPLSFCKNALKAEKYHVREEPLIRHMKSCVRRENRTCPEDRQVSISDLKTWTRRNMQLFQYDREVFRNEFEAAAWRIHNA